ncbi:MAG: VWA domain-containing protein [Burkholderiales bacterium]|nr:VWA domain-containing protein [Burkholderiales bacterium]
MRDEPAMLRSTTGETMTLEGVDAKGRVRGLLFELDVEQRYRNPRDTNVEAIYTFPLPSDAVILGLDVTLNDRKLVAAVVERKAAERSYEEAIDKGDSAIMLERAADGLCTLNLGNLMAGERATIRYRYARLLRFEHGSVRITVPTVIAPRYGDPQAGGLAPHQAPASDLAVAYPFTLAIDLEGEIAAGTLASPSHALSIAATATGMHVGLAGGAFLDRDFVLTVAGLEGRSLAVVARDGERYVALASFCADVPKAADELPLTVKLLVDCSGSMGGDSIDATRRALHRILANLDARDRFSYSRFGSSVVHETQGLVRADEAAVRAAALRVGQTDADLGGTEMESALGQVFAIGGRDGAADVLMLTDGEVWNAEHLIAEARGAHQRVFVVGIGSAPAEGVLSKLAEATGGACEFVAPNEDAEAAILRMFSRLRAPRVERADVTWPATPGWATPLPRGLFGGETVHAYAGFDTAPTGAVAIALHAKAGTPPLTAATEIGATIVEDRTLARMAAARRIESASEDEALRLALDYELLTARTNLLVVHERAAEEKAADLPQLAQVAQMHAAGWHGVGSVRRLASMSVDSAVVDFACLDRLPNFGDLTSRSASTCGLYVHSDPRPPEVSEGRSNASAPDAQGASDTLDAFLRRLAADHAQRVPTTLRELLDLGVPAAIVERIATLVGSDASEADVVAAFVAEAVRRDRSASPLAWLTPRALRHRLAARRSTPELRNAVRGVVDEWSTSFAVVG